MDHHLANKTVLLTGASRGLGEAIARQLAAAGARLALIARDKTALDNFANSLRAAVGPSHAIGAFPCDLADLSSIDGVYERIARELGDIDVLVNNAAVQGPLGLLESLDFAEWRKVFDVDLFAAVRLCQLVI